MTHRGYLHTMIDIDFCKHLYLFHKVLFLVCTNIFDELNLVFCYSGGFTKTI